MFRELTMGIPYPSEVLGPPLMAIWEAYGETIIKPLFAWAFVGLVTLSCSLIVFMLYLAIRHGVPLSYGQAMAQQRRALYEEMRRMRAANEKAPGQ